MSASNLKKQFPQITLQQFQTQYLDPQPIGSGSFGTVMRASTGQGNTVAIKQFNHDSLLFFQSINREISNLRLLNHINIIAYYDCFVVEGDTYLLITEYCSQGSLKDYTLSALNDFEKMKLCMQIAEGLAYAHEHNVVHRDIKPENIFISEGAVPKLGDFGCSTMLQQEVEVMNSRVGTAIWADPKVNLGRYTRMVDIYSSALVFIFIFKGRGLYDQCSSLFDLTKQRNKLYRDYENRMDAELEGLPQVMKDIIRRCLDVDDSKRYEAREIAGKIKRFLQNQGKIASNMISTLDDQDFMDADITSQAISLVNFYKRLQQQEKCENTKNKLYQILSHNAGNVMQLKQIQSLLFVSETAKSQYSFFIILYYMSWIEQIEAILQGRDSILAENYPQIDPDFIHEGIKREIQSHLAAERIKFKPFLSRCARLAHSQLRLLDSSVYFPDCFKEIVTAIAQGSSINYSKLSDIQLRTDMKTFYEQRIRKEYYARQKDGIVDPKLAIMQQISLGFK